MIDRDGYRPNVAIVLVNHKKVYRPYCEEKLAVRGHRGRKRALGTRAPLALPSAQNQRWSLDFMSDTLRDGRQFRVLAIVGGFTSKSLALIVDT